MVVYAFFKPTPNIRYNDGRKMHEFTCLRQHCRQKILRYLDTKDAQSTGNMRRHVKKCWGEGVLTAAESAKDANEARSKIVNGFLKTGKITEMFERKANVTYSTIQHTKSETRAEIVRWVAESLRPFAIVKDRGFRSLMKTGRPDYYIPSPSTVARDVKAVFARARNRISKILKVCCTSGELLLLLIMYRRTTKDNLTLQRMLGHLLITARSWL
jgi:hypothetical protein